MGVLPIFGMVTHSFTKEIGGNIAHLFHTLAWFNISVYTLWLFNIAMENGPFIDELPI